MSSVGQALGMAVGGVIGAFTPVGFIVGAQIGGMVGGYLDPPKGPNTQGPRLTDLKQQTASYGVPIPRLYGKDAVFGNVFWIENNQIKEVATKKKTGGKGGGSKGSVTEFSYYGTFAVGVCLGPVAAIKRIWLNGKLFYVGASSDMSTIVGSTQVEQYFTAYLGTDDQQPDPRMQAALGVNATPAFRGLCYLVFKDLPLADYGNTIVGTQVKVEVLKNATSGPAVIYTTTAFGGTTYPHIANLDDGLISINAVRTGDYVRRYQAGWAIADQIAGDVLFQNPGSYVEYTLAWGNVGLFAGRYYYAQHNQSADGLLGWGELEYRTGPYRMELINGARIDAGIIADRVANGYSATWSPRVVTQDVRGLGLFVIDHNARWYFIDADGVVFASGPSSGIRTGYGDYAFSSGNGEANYAFGCAAFDSLYMRYARPEAGSATEGLLHTYVVDASGTLVQEHFVSSLGWPNNITMVGSIYLLGNVVAMQFGANNFAVVDLESISETATNVRDIVSAECALSRFLDPTDIDVSELERAITGYTVSSVGQLRTPLEQLQAFYPFDVFQDGYKILFRPRGGASLATYDVSDLVIEGQGDAILTRVRETDSRLPVRVSIKYSDAGREYDLSEQYAERHDGDLANVRTIELPIVMSANEAAGVAQRLLNLYWLERYENGFTLPPTARKHQPSDVITLTTPDETLLVRLTTAEDYPDARLACTARLAGQTLYSPAAVGEVTAAPSEVLVPNGPTMSALLDIPYLMSGMDQAGFVAAMYSPMPSWSGGAFYNSNDGGESWNAIRAITENATAGRATTVLGAAASYQIVDAINTVTIRLNHGTLASVTLLAMFNGANHFALGAHGRWEICAAQTVTDHGDGSYTLSNLMRGRYGTEQYASTHTSTDTFVLLDSADLAFITVPVGNIGLQKLWRAVGRDKALDSASDIAFTYTGENLECRSPIRPRGNRNPSTLDWTLECTPRSRTPVEPFSGVPTPIGEAIESYDFEIWDATFSTLKRTFSRLPSPTVSWTKAQQISDFGIEQEDVFYRWYPLSGAVGRGHVLQGSISQFIDFDPHPELTVLNIDFVGSEGSTSFSDSVGHTITAYGDAHISTEQYRFNASSGKFSGAGYLSVSASSSLNFSSSDLTIEIWAMRTAVNDGTYADALLCSASNPVGLAIGLFADGKLGISVDSPAGGDWDIRKGCDPGDPRGSITIPLNTWVKIKVCRSGNTWYGLINDVLDQTFTSSAAISNTPSGYFIGHWHDGWTRCFKGYIGKIKIKNGICII